MVQIDIAQASDLQDAIQKQLAEYGYSTDDDPVMAEYVTVMLANNKSAAQITTELSDLIGAEYESAFTEWIFQKAIPQYYTRSNGANGGGQSADTPTTPAAPAAATAAGPAATDSTSTGRQPEQPERIQTVGDSRDSRDRPRHGLPTRPSGSVPTGPRNASGSQGSPQQRGGGSGVFGTAMAGLKREGDALLDRGSRNRPRMSSEFEQQQQQNGRGRAGQPNGERSIFDRAGVQAGIPPAQHMRPGPSGPRGFPGPAGGPQQNPFGGPPIQQVPGLPPLHIPDNFNSLPFAQQQAIQQQIFQHQLIAAAAAQQMFQGGPPGVPGGPPHQPGPGAFGMQPPHFPPQPQQQQLNPRVPHFQQQQQPQPRKPVTLPARPSSEELCKYGVDCKNAICHYSHPSPSATKESGLVLTKDVCEKGIACDDKDCPKSHVSPAQKTDPEGLNAAQYKPKAAVSKAPPQPVVVQHLPALNPGAKPCMYGTACTRPGCFFSHPPNPTATPCRFGTHCTRKDCHFSHPEGRKIDHTAGYGGPSANGGPAGSRGNKSATFGSNGAVTGSGAASPTVPTAGSKEDESRMSARMKKFTTSSEGEGDKERIVGGKEVKDGPAPSAAGESAQKKEEDDLEVVI